MESKLEPTLKIGDALYYEGKNGILEKTVEAVVQWADRYTYKVHNELSDVDEDEDSHETVHEKQKGEAYYEGRRAYYASKKELQKVINTEAYEEAQKDLKNCLDSRCKILADTEHVKSLMEIAETEEDDPNFVLGLCKGCKTLSYKILEDHGDARLLECLDCNHYGKCRLYVKRYKSTGLFLFDRMLGESEHDYFHTDNRFVFGKRKAKQFHYSRMLRRLAGSLARNEAEASELTARSDRLKLLPRLKSRKSK
jgi:hypothetical protein